MDGSTMEKLQNKNDAKLLLAERPIFVKEFQGSFLVLMRFKFFYEYIRYEYTSMGLHETLELHSGNFDQN